MRVRQENVRPEPGCAGSSIRFCDFASQNVRRTGGNWKSGNGQRLGAVAEERIGGQIFRSLDATPFPIPLHDTGVTIGNFTFEVIGGSLRTPSSRRRSKSCEIFA